jgi:cytochrome bd-type quinol oxidase subunit 2
VPRAPLSVLKGQTAEEAYMVKYDLLVYLGLIPLVAVIIFGGFVIWKTPADIDLETRKLRIADAVLVGLLALFIFTAILYFVDAQGAGQEIFNKASTVIFALVGTIVGYIFGTRKQ